MIKSLRSTFAALAACGLLISATGAAFAAAPKDYQITGNISELTDTTVTLVTLKKETWGFARSADTKLPDGAKVGDKVTVHYTMTAAMVDAKPDAAAKKDKPVTTTKTSKKAKADTAAAPATTEPAASGSPSKPAAEAASPTP